MTERVAATVGEWGGERRAGGVEQHATPGRAPAAARRIQWWGRRSSTAGVAGFFAILLLCFSVLVHGFASTSNAVTIASTASEYMIVSLGQLLAIISGGFDLAVGGMVPLGAVTFAVLTNDGVGLVPAIAVTLAAGVVLGLVHAVAINKVGINPLITTLATLSITGGFAYTVAGGLTVEVTPSAGVLGNLTAGGLPYFAYITLGLVVLVHLLLRHTILGRRIYMIGGNPEAARLAGVRVFRVLAAVYGLSGVLAAFAGVTLASELLAATGGVGTDTTLTSVAACVLGGAALTGGVGGVPGTVLGVLLLETIQDALNIMHVASFYQQILTGCVLLAAVTFGIVQGRSNPFARGTAPTARRWEFKFRPTSNMPIERPAGTSPVGNSNERS